MFKIYAINDDDDKSFTRLTDPLTDL